MYCSKLDHTVNIRVMSPQITRCCVQTNAEWSSTYDQLVASEWIANIKDILAKDEWPIECSPCQFLEQHGIESPRQSSNTQSELLVKINKDYLVVGFVVDSECNAACISCGPNRSSLISKLMKIEKNVRTEPSVYDLLPKSQILELDLIGGEPAVSKEFKILLDKLSHPSYRYNINKIRTSTNGSRPIYELEKLLVQGVELNVSLSMDGYERSFEYARWPVTWQRFTSTVIYYLSIREKYPNLNLFLWSTYSALSIGDYNNMLIYSNKMGIPLLGVPMRKPAILDIARNNFMTQRAKQKLIDANNGNTTPFILGIATDTEDTSDALYKFLQHADIIRGINFNDFYNYRGAHCG